MTGHLLEEARRYERPVVYRAAALDGERVILDYSAVVTNQFAERLGETPRRVAIPLSELAGRDGRTPRFEHVSPRMPSDGRPLALRTGGACVDGAAPFVAVDEGADGDTRISVCGTGEPLSPLPAAALTSTRTAGWAYPLVPLALVVDAVSNPLLLMLVPVVIAVGD